MCNYFPIILRTPRERTTPFLFVFMLLLENMKSDIVGRVNALACLIEFQILSILDESNGSECLTCSSPRITSTNIPSVGSSSKIPVIDRSSGAILM